MTLHQAVVSKSVRSNIGKLFQRMIERRLRTFLEEESIEEEPEGIHRSKNKLGSLYRVNLQCESAKTHEESEALLNLELIKPSKACGSIA